MKFTRCMTPVERIALYDKKLDSTRHGAPNALLREILEALIEHNQRELKRRRAGQPGRFGT